GDRATAGLDRLASSHLPADHGCAAANPRMAWRQEARPVRALGRCPQSRQHGGTRDMSLTSKQQEAIAEFRECFERGLANDPRFAKPTRDDRPDQSTLATRWASVVNPNVWFEAAVRPFLPQLRIGLLTDDRWKSE